MENIQAKLPIRNRKIKNPVVFAFNITCTHFLAYKSSQYSRLAQAITSQDAIEKDDKGNQKFKLLPNTVNVSMGIEQRAKKLS